MAAERTGTGSERRLPPAGLSQQTEGGREDQGALPGEAYAAALAGVPGIGPKGLRSLLDARTPRGAWEALTNHADGDPRRAAWACAAARMDVRAIWQTYTSSGIRVAVRGRDGYPGVLASDPEAPAVLFSVGEPLVLDRFPRVAVVGTRSATRYGLAVAAELSADLAAMGVVVVSGLALGIDGAAHEGALAGWAPARDGARGGRPPPARFAAGSAPPVGVVAGDVASPYPRRHAGLWGRVAQSGAVISEAPLGTADLGWRFPLRNRIMAAVANVVVVVECHATGGSMHTVQAANRRGIPVGAVPGSVRSPSSSGTNGLLADGCFVVRDAVDVAAAVGLATAADIAVKRRTTRLPPRPGPGQGAAGEQEPDLTRQAVLSALGWERCSVEEVLRRTGLPLDAASRALERLRIDGEVHGEGGFWERS